MKNSIALITGATGGIGKAAAIALAKQNFTVIIHGRNKEKAIKVRDEIITLTANPNIDILVADMFLLSDVNAMAAQFKQKYNKLDVLINNAGGIMSKNREVTLEGLENTMAVNLFAPFLLTGLLLDLLKQSNDGRIINVSSSSHRLNAKPDFADLQMTKNYNPLNAYGNAKLFIIWVTQHLQAKFIQDGINNVTANVMHPGAVRTNFGVNSNLGSALNLIGKLARPLFRTAEQGADTLLYLATANDLPAAGKYFVDRKMAKVSTKYYTPQNEKLVWDYCNTITGLDL